MTSTAGRTTLAAQLEMYSSNGSVAQTDFSHRIVAHIRGHPKSVRHRSNSLKGNKRFSSLPDVTKNPSGRLHTVLLSPCGRCYVRLSSTYCSCDSQMVNTSLTNVLEALQGGVG